MIRKLVCVSVVIVSVAVLGDVSGVRRARSVSPLALTGCSSSCQVDEDCGDTESCCDSHCVDEDTDKDNCGSCGNACDSDQSCKQGQCCDSQGNCD